MQSSIKYSVELVERLGSQPVVTVEAFKLHMGIEHTLHDAYIQERLSAATMYAERHQSRALLLSRYNVHLDCWPRAVFTLPVSPLRSVDAITYTDANGAQQDLDPVHIIAGQPGSRGRLAFTGSLPSLLADGFDTVTIEVVAGYGEYLQTPGGGLPYSLPIVMADPVVTGGGYFPETATQAVLMLAAHWYENREAVTIGAATSQVDLTTDDLLHQNRILGI